MSGSVDVQKLAEELHQHGIINLDTPLRTLLKPTAIGLTNPNSPVADNAVAWSDYVLVTKGRPSAISEAANVARNIRGTIAQP